MASKKKWGKVMKRRKKFKKKGEEIRTFREKC
jgi:hypothetical protein